VIYAEQNGKNFVRFVQHTSGLDPYAYLADVLRRLPTHPDSQIDALLPHVWKPPQ